MFADIPPQEDWEGDVIPDEVERAIDAIHPGYVPGWNSPLVRPIIRGYLKTPQQPAFGVHHWEAEAFGELHNRWQKRSKVISLPDFGSQLERVHDLFNLILEASPIRGYRSRKFRDTQQLFANMLGFKIKSNTIPKVAPSEGYMAEVDYQWEQKTGDPLRFLSAFGDPFQTRHPAVYLQSMFAAGEFVCCGTSAANAFSLTLEQWVAESSLARFNQVVPNPMKSDGAVGQNGKWNARNDANAAGVRHVVFELDMSDVDHTTQAARILELATRYRLRGVVDSSSKSLHAFFVVQGNTASEQANWRLELCRLIMMLGGDPICRVVSQYFRLPEGIHPKTGENQQVVCWSENPQGFPLLQKP